MKDIYLLSDIFLQIISKTEFKDELNRDLALDLIESMRDFCHKQCDPYLRNKWFGSQEMAEKDVSSKHLRELFIKID